MGKYIRSQTRFFKDGRADKADAGEVLEMLGLRKGGHLPKKGMPEQLIQGIRVYIKPYDPKRKGHRAHRVYAHCDCGKDVPVGRLHQHKCKCEYCGVDTSTEEAMDMLVQHPDGTWCCPAYHTKGLCAANVPKFKEYLRITHNRPGLGKSWPSIQAGVGKSYAIESLKDLYEAGGTIDPGEENK